MVNEIGLMDFIKNITPSKIALYENRGAVQYDKISLSDLIKILASRQNLKVYVEKEKTTGKPILCISEDRAEFGYACEELRICEDFILATSYDDGAC